MPHSHRPSPTHTAHVPVVVVGGGVAGLWALHTLRTAGYAAVLLEKTALGQGQTLAAQGILHGGMKYALDGKVDDIALKLRAMPARWLAAMAGQGEDGADLRQVAVLSPHQYLFSDRSLLSKFSAALGSKLMSGDTVSLAEAEIPEILRRCQPVRQLQETIIDTKSALAALAAPHQEFIYQAADFAWQAESARVGLPEGGELRLTADAWVFTAGVGNEIPAEALHLPAPATQRRPLCQILVKNAPCSLFGHCVAADPKPRFTITTHALDSGELVWYLGGNVAEKGAHLSDLEAIAFAQKELAAVFPEVDWKSKAHAFATWRGDRAEPHQTSRFMPAEPTVQRHGNCLIAWPTKLVFAPGLASRIHTEIEKTGLAKPGDQFSPLPLPGATMGKFPWETADWR